MTASADGRYLYVGIGSNSNVGERGMAVEEDRAVIWQIDPATGMSRIFASGIRNPTALTIQPGTGALWAAVNERDELGPNLVPDYLTSVRPGGFYGWPYAYWGQNVDTRVRPAVAQDGGDITFHGFDRGVVYLHMQGACAGCPSSTLTLKMGIENLLRHYIPEVVEVRPVA